MDTREISAVSKDNPTRSTELTYSGLQLELRLKMTSFGWKRKRNLRTSAAAAFGGEKEQEEDEEEAWVADGVDWLTAAKRRRTLLLEDSESKSKRYSISANLISSSLFASQHLFALCRSFLLFFVATHQPLHCLSCCQVAGGGCSPGREWEVLGSYQVLG